MKDTIFGVSGSICIAYIRYHMLSTCACELVALRYV